jgi:hypothetical protein
MSSTPPSGVEREIWRGLELPDESVVALLDHLERFCLQHGGERHYADLIALVQRMKAAQAGA